MKYLLLFFIASILFSQANAQQVEWNLSFPSHKSPPLAIKDIAPLDSLHAFIVGDFLRIGYTDDGGKSWQYTSVNAPGSDSAADFTTIHFTDTMHGWAASGSSGIARTIDGGKTWQWGNGSFKKKFSIVNWKDMTFVDSLSGWAVGRWDSAGIYHPMMARTNDGGKTWNTIAMDSTYREFNSCAFLNKNIGIATGVCNWLFRTSNGGVSWNMMLPVGKMEVVNYVSILPDSSFAVCNQDGVLYSKDKGLTWILDITSSLKYHSLIRFSDSLHGISSRIQIYYSGPSYSITKDGGKTWISKEFPNGASEWLDFTYILSSSVAPDGSLWLSDDRGMILRSVDAGNTWKNLACYSDAFTKITFNSPLSGWISISNNYNLLMHTSDGGKTWIPHLPFDTLKYISNGPFFLDEKNGWYYEELGEYGYGRMLKKTTDNGVTWTEVSRLPSSTSEYFYPISDSVLITSLTTPGNPEWAISKDAGKNWTDSRNLHKQDSVDFWDLFSYRYKKINRTTGLGIIQKDNGRVRTTTNAGSTWKTTPLPPPLDKQNIVACIIDSNLWWVVGGYKYLARTTDGGVTWKDYTSKINLKEYSISRIEFSDKYNGVISTYGNIDGTIIFVTTNGGESWERASIELFDEYPVKYVRDITSSSDGTFWACGENGMLISWKPSITSVEEQHLTQTSNEVSIYPNPTSTSFTISGIDSISSLRVVNSIGVEVITMQTINNRQNVDVSALTNGLYFVNIIGNTKTIMKPLVINR